VNRPEEIVDAIRGLPADERRRVVERVVREFAGAPDAQARTAAERMLGLFADEPDLADAICEGAMQAREAHPLRLPDA
jgi:hypothetical protein